jgi:AcrR family transcriptional regulator
LRLDPGGRILLANGLFRDEARNLGKSARTRACLMDAAVALFARDGFEAASVNEIARLAEVANGTFYVHFRDKDEIAAAVAFTVAAHIVGQLDAAMTDVDDAVERVSLATRRFVDLASSQPDWGRALFRAVWLFPRLRDQVTANLRADLERGHAQGAFTVAIDDIVLVTIASMSASALFGRLQGAFGPEAGSRMAELQLRMLGVAPDLAGEVAWRPIPPLSLEIAPTARAI